MCVFSSVALQPVSHIQVFNWGLKYYLVFFTKVSSVLLELISRPPSVLFLSPLLFWFPRLLRRRIPGRPLAVFASGWVFMLFPFWPVSFVKQEVWKAASDHLLKCVEHLAAAARTPVIGCHHSVFITVAFCSRGEAGTGGFGRVAALFTCTAFPLWMCTVREFLSNKWAR